MARRGLTEADGAVAVAVLADGALRAVGGSERRRGLDLQLAARLAAVVRRVRLLTHRALDCRRKCTTFQLRE